jgi:hypothetical protein
MYVQRFVFFAISLFLLFLRCKYRNYFRYLQIFTSFFYFFCDNICAQGDCEARTRGQESCEMETGL